MEATVAQKERLVASGRPKSGIRVSELDEAEETREPGRWHSSRRLIWDVVARRRQRRRKLLVRIPQHDYSTAGRQWPPLCTEALFLDVFLRARCASPRRASRLERRQTRAGRSSWALRVPANTRECHIGPASQYLRWSRALPRLLFATRVFDDVGRVSCMQLVDRDLAQGKEHATSKLSNVWGWFDHLFSFSRTNGLRRQQRGPGPSRHRCGTASHVGDATGNGRRAT